MTNTDEQGTLHKWNRETSCAKGRRGLNWLSTGAEFSQTISRKSTITVFGTPDTSRTLGHPQRPRQAKPWGVQQVTFIFIKMNIWNMFHERFSQRKRSECLNNKQEFWTERSSIALNSSYYTLVLWILFLLIHQVSLSLSECAPCIFPLLLLAGIRDWWCKQQQS